MSTKDYLYFFVTIFALLVGTGMGMFMLCVGKLKTYFEKKQNNPNKPMKILQVIWNLSLPLIFALFAFIIPAQIMYMTVNRICNVGMSNFVTLYLCCFAVAFALSMFLLIKTGKIQVSKNSK